MYREEYKRDGVCERCGKLLTGKQKRWCSPNCSRLGLKREWKKRHPEKLREYKQRRGTPINEKIANELKKTKACARCCTRENLTIHHIKPVTKGGTHHVCNLMVLCWKCHMRWEKKMKNYWM